MKGSFDLPACSAVTGSGCVRLTVCERSAPVICAFSSCPLEHLALIYPSLSNNTAGGFKGRRPKSLCVCVCCTVSKQLYFAPFFISCTLNAIFFKNILLQCYWVPAELH